MNVIKLAKELSRTHVFEALIFDDTAYSNVELEAEAKRIAHVLKTLGQERGDIVATILPNCMQIIPIYEAVLRRGAVLLPIIFVLTPREIAFLLQDSGAKVLFTNKHLREKVLEALKEVPQELAVIEIDGDGSDFLSYESLMEDAAEDDEIVDRSGDDLAIVMYTSGTTGKPKGVMLTHGNFSSLLRSKIYDFFGKDNTLIAVPMNHMFGFLVMLLYYWKWCGTVILHERFDPEKALRDIERYRIKTVPLVPTMLLRLAKQQEVTAYDTSSVRVWVSAAAPFPPSKIKDFEDRLGGVLVCDYGLNESTGEVACQRPDEVRKSRSAGKPFPGLEVKILDSEGREVPEGEWGEICVKGWSVMKGYLNRPAETEEALRDGWLHTGDIGYVDQDGDLFITDRKKEMVLRGGENISPAEIEEALYKHPALSEVAVIGLPDDQYGEEVYAVVVLKPHQQATQEDILEKCKEYVPRYKCPKKIFFWETLPQSSNGKILKRAVREKVLQNGVS